MKKVILISAMLTIIMLACSKPEPKLELFSPEAFAYQLDKGWELNATVGVKGFQQNEKDDKFFASLSYTVDLITPTDTVKNVDRGTIDEKNDEEFLDLMIDSQIEMDSSFAIGDYQLIFFVEDNNSKSSSTASAKFKLTLD